MQKISLRNFIIEVTRRCNMSCSHCLRGPAQNLDQTKEHVYSLFKQVDYIGSLTLSGGEPSIACDQIEFICDAIEELGVGLGYVYIATNALDIQHRFISVWARLVSLCDEPDECYIDVSNDPYHAFEGMYDTKLLDCLKGVRLKWRQDWSFKDATLINEGNAKENCLVSSPREQSVTSVSCRDDLDDTELYLNCEGVIINGCDWSYDNQPNYELCSVGQLAKFYGELEEE